MYRIYLRFARIIFVQCFLVCANSLIVRREFKRSGGSKTPIVLSVIGIDPGKFKENIKYSAVICIFPSTSPNYCSYRYRYYSYEDVITNAEISTI